MRGKPKLNPRKHKIPRIIPAHAGQTSSWPPSTGLSPDHPRACGANEFLAAQYRSFTGSSPRMRGKRRWCRYCSLLGRIIPAHAGQTCGRLPMYSARSDHPRACGANEGRYRDTRITYGSSPRMRGKRWCGVGLQDDGRIIPAHAGQTACSASTARHASDHPRACGANDSAQKFASTLNGSSPRMRGKLSVSVMASL